MEQTLRRELQESTRANFQQALDLDPTYAQGYAGLADSYVILGYYNALAPMEADPKAKAAAMKALELDHSLAQPHATLGVIKRDFEWDWSGSEQEFARAVALNPGYAEAHHWHGTLHGMLGHHAEALAKKTHALSLDPLSVVVRTDLARILYCARDYDRSIAQYRATLEMDPNFGSAHLWFGQVYEQKRMFDLAIAEFQTGVQLTGGSAFSLAKLAHGFALVGSPDRSRSLLSELLDLRNQKYVSPFDVAMTTSDWASMMKPSPRSTVPSKSVPSGSAI